MRPSILGVGQQHGVVHGHGRAKSGPGQRPQPGLGVVEHLQHGCIGQHRVQSRPKLQQADLLHLPVQVRGMADRHVARLARRRGQAQAHQPLGARYRVERQNAAPADALQHGR